MLGELAVQIYAPVHRVAETADADPGVRIRAGRPDGHGVLGVQSVQPQPAIFRDCRQVPTVELGGEYRGTAELDEGSASGRAARKRDRRAGFESLVARGEVEAHVVVIDRDEPGSLARLGAREVVMR